jgi:O-antigen/teichoic acid export membrane protein
MTEPHAPSSPDDERTTPLEAGNPGRRVAGSTITLVASAGSVGLIGAAAIGVLTHRLGISAYGQLATVLAFISATLLFTDLGINSYSGREIARRKQDASTILGQNLGLRLVLALVMVPTIIGLSEAFYPHSDTKILDGIILVSLTIPFEAFRAVSLSYYVATIQNYKTAILNVVTQVVYVGGAILALYFGYGLTGCFVAYDISVAVTALIAFLAVRKSVAFAPMLSIRSWGGIIRQSLGIGAIQIVNLLYLRTNTLVLSRMTNSHTVALYAVAAAIVLFLLVLPNAFMLSMTPLLVVAPITKLKTLVNDSCTYMAMVGVVAVVGTACLAHDVVKLLAPASFAGSSVVLSILSLSVLFTCITNVFTYSSFARDQHHRLLLISVLGLVSNVVIDLVLIPSLHAKGAAIATVIVEGFILVGTYTVFRLRVGPQFDAWTRIGRILVLGAGSYFAFHVALNDLPLTTAEQLVIGVIVIPSVLLGAFVACRCMPDSVSVRTLVSRTLRSASPR